MRDKDKDIARQALEQVEDAGKEQRISLYREQFKKLLSAIEEDKKTIAEANRRKQIREKMVDYLKAGQLDKALELQNELGEENECLPFKLTKPDQKFIDGLNEWERQRSSTHPIWNVEPRFDTIPPLSDRPHPTFWVSTVELRSGSTGTFNLGSRTIII